MTFMYQVGRYEILLSIAACTLLMQSLLVVISLRTCIYVYDVLTPTMIRRCFLVARLLDLLVRSSLTDALALVDLGWSGTFFHSAAGRKKNIACLILLFPGFINRRGWNYKVVFHLTENKTAL